MKQAPYLTIAERKWSSGWFRSEQEVTFEILGPWTQLLKDAEQKQAAAADPTPRRTAAPDREPLRFTVHNEILHGPVLWPASLGLARINSKLVMSEEIRKLLLELFGTDEPVRISTRVGFLGGGTTSLSGDAPHREVREGRECPVIRRLSPGRGLFEHLDHMDVDGKFPRIEITEKKDGARVLLENMTLTSQMNRIHGDLYDTDFRFGIEKVQMVNANQQATEISGIHYDLDTNEDGDFVDFAAKLGSGKFKSPELAELKLDINEIHYDFTLRRLHAQTLENLMTAIKASYEKPVASVADVEQALTSPYKQYGVALLKHDPELAIDRIGIVTPEGEGVIKGVIRMKGVTEQDFEAGNAMGLIGKVDADLTIEVAQKLVEKIAERRHQRRHGHRPGLRQARR